MSFFRRLLRREEATRVEEAAGGLRVVGRVERVRGHEVKVEGAAAEAAQLINKAVHVEVEEGLVVDPEILVEMYVRFERFLGLAGGLLYNAAKSVGRRMAEKLMKQGIVERGDAVGAAVLAAASMVSAGYARRAEVLVNGADASEVRVKAWGTLFGSRLRGQRRRPVDTAAAGFLAGFMEAVTGVKYEALEEMCEGKGDDHCEFHIVRR